MGDDAATGGGLMPAPDRSPAEGMNPHILIPTPWMDNAACADADPDLFFVDVGESADEAKAICSRCPVQTDCLDFALASHERFGIWGGMSSRQRRVEARRRKEAA